MSDDVAKLSTEELLERLEDTRREVARREEAREADESHDADLNAEIRDAERNLGRRRGRDRSLSAKAAKLQRMQGRTDANAHGDPSGGGES